MDEKKHQSIIPAKRSEQSLYPVHCGIDETTLINFEAGYQATYLFAIWHGPCLSFAN
jgi:hypothetical protein